MYDDSMDEYSTHSSELALGTPDFMLTQMHPYSMSMVLYVRISCPSAYSRASYNTVFNLQVGLWGSSPLPKLFANCRKNGNTEICTPTRLYQNQCLRA